MQQSGFFWHPPRDWPSPHERLLDWRDDYAQDIIRAHKPPKEQKLRLRLFQPVKGQLPQEVVEAGNALKKAEKALHKILAIYTCGHGVSRDDVYSARKAYFEALSSHKDEIEELHKQECLNCPWDGKTIFPAA